MVSRIDPIRQTLKQGNYKSDENQYLLARVVKKDVDAFTLLYDRLNGPVFNYLLHLIHEKPVAEELLQETFVAVWQGARRFRAKSAVKTWIFQIAHNKAVSWLRVVKNEIAFDEQIEANIPLNINSLEETAIGNWEQGEVSKALDKLSPNHRAVIELTFVQGFSYPEIAEIMQCPTGTVKSRMSYALKHLSQELIRRGLD